MFKTKMKENRMCVGHRVICFWQDKKAEIDLFDFISDVGIRGIYLSLALGTAKFKQLD